VRRVMVWVGEPRRGATRTPSNVRRPGQTCRCESLGSPKCACRSVPSASRTARWNLGCFLGCAISCGWTDVDRKFGIGFLLSEEPILGFLGDLRFGSRAAVARLYHVGAKGLAEREGFPACENEDCTLCCWEGHSALCYTAHGWKDKSNIRHPAVKPLDLRFGPSWTNRTNKTKASSLSAI
jgi:hypothetical protein